MVYILGLPYTILFFIGCALVEIVAHEGLHGLFFKLFGGDVSIGIKRTKLGPIFWTSSSILYSRIKY